MATPWGTAYSPLNSLFAVSYAPEDSAISAVSSNGVDVTITGGGYDVNGTGSVSNNHLVLTDTTSVWSGNFMGLKQVIPVFGSSRAIHTAAEGDKLAGGYGTILDGDFDINGLNGNQIGVVSNMGRTLTVRADWLDNNETWANDPTQDKNRALKLVFADGNFTLTPFFDTNGMSE